METEKEIYEFLKEKKSWEFIDTLNITTEYIEKFMKKMSLSVEKREREEFLEKKMKLPSMVTYFYYFLYLHKRIPTQVEYIKFYYKMNKNWVLEQIGEEYHQALIGRLSRFYPSMMRDIHFYHLLKESNQFEKVLFTLKYDLEGKVDVFIKKDGKWYGLQLRTKTKNSHYFYGKKKDRNMIEVSAELIDMPIDLSIAKSIKTKKEDIKLYSENNITEVIEKIKKSKLKDII